MKRLIKVEDIGCGDYGTRPKHYCYINIPQEYIVETEEKLFSSISMRLSLTKEGEEFIENNVPIHLMDIFHISMLPMNIEIQSLKCMKNKFQNFNLNLMN